ncbi:MAG: type II secretion system protein GspK [Candidatus Omnitrophica bacterium]|nr:type II secretion system protein GspK [Candidatus Omnitrophota bacterium]
MGLELKLTGFNRDSAAAMYLAEAGVKRATEVIISKKDHTMDALNERWSCNNEEADPLFKDIKIGEAGAFTVSYLFHDKRVFYGVQDEEGRININNAPKDVIARLIVYLDPASAADEISSNIEDWRDPDKARQDGSPEYDYIDEGYGRKDTLFDSSDEVLLVKGMDRGLYDRIKGYITVYPIAGSGCRINVNTAPLPVLKALGFSDADAGAIIATRAGSDGLDGTQDDAPFMNKDAFTTYLANAGIALPENMGLVSCGSNFFRVVSKGYASGGRVVKTVTCVISVTAGSILYWNEE